MKKLKKIKQISFEHIQKASLLKINPDLIIRTAGEKRLSGFLPINSMYSEFYFSKKLWPEFKEDNFVKALKTYSKRKRKFGK